MAIIQEEVERLIAAGLVFLGEEEKQAEESISTPTRLSATLSFPKKPDTAAKKTHPVAPLRSPEVSFLCILVYYLLYHIIDFYLATLP